MRRPRWRTLLSLGLVGCMALSLMPLGCYSVKLKHYPGQDDRPRVPEGTEERLKACVEELKDGINAGSYSVDAKVKVDEDGDIVGVETEGTPNPDVGTCMRMALRNMRLPEGILEQGTLRTSASANRQAMPDRGQMGEIVTITVVTIVFTEIIIEAFAITIGVTVAATVAAGTIRGKEEPERQRCKKAKQECITYCSDTTLPTPDFGWKFQKCKNDCLERHACPRDS